MQKFILTATFIAVALLHHACVGNRGAERRLPLRNLGNGACQQASGLMWQAGTSPVFDNWNEASFYAENLELAGHDDWRLPSKEELYTLCNLFDLQQAGDCRLEIDNNYWTGGQPEHGEVGFWESYSLCGGSEFKYIPAREGVVRAVRP
ncbi:Lcl C-terminal domain-containing protein [Thiovibrio sp. JS02]